MSLLKEGQLLQNTYEVERFLGEGAFAEVYRVKHRFLGRQAMKIFKTSGVTREELDKNLNEALILSKVGHPNVIRVFDANTAELKGNTYGYYTMEYIAGGSLDKYWRSYGNQFVPIEITVDILKQICLGLAVAHKSSPPIVHRDIKPQNILVGNEADGLRIRISDFGLAKHVNPLTLLASAQGTICFKPPEVFSKPISDSCSGDVWAIGCTAYMLLTDQFPFPNLVDVPVIHQSDFCIPITPPNEINCCVDPILEEIVSNCLEFDMSRRYQNAQELLYDLNEWKPSLHQKKNIVEGYTSKESLGPNSPRSNEEGQLLAEKALRLSLQAGCLLEAADLMEEAFRHSSELREKYQYTVCLWRRGIIQ